MNVHLGRCKSCGMQIYRRQDGTEVWKRSAKPRTGPHQHRKPYTIWAPETGQDDDRQWQHNLRDQGAWRV